MVHLIRCILYAAYTMQHIKDFGVLEPKAHPKHTLSSWIEDVYLAA